MAAVIAPLKYLTVAPVTKHTATVIFIHGLGDSGEGWRPVADLLQKDSGISHVKWVLPHSPSRRVTANRGVVMPSWFDVESFGFAAMEDEKGMMETVSSLNQLINNEIEESGIQPSRIVLGGFSQGGAMSLLTGLTTEKKLAGVVALSGWVPLAAKFKQMASSHASSLPLFWGHGTLDPLVEYNKMGVASVELLKTQLGFPTTTKDGDLKGLLFNSYPIGHSTSMQELEDLRDWLKRALPKESDA